MIKKLQNSDIAIAKKMRAVFQSSYEIEAKLLNATDFPPLKRSLDNYVNSKTEFIGYCKDQEIIGVIELETNEDLIHIDSLVVDPKFFRKGIASELLEFVINTFNSNIFTVETGLENGPATELYKKFEFKEVKQWDTDNGIRKIKFEKRINN